MIYTISNGQEREVDWVTIILDNDEIEKYTKQMAGVSESETVKLKVEINDEQGYVDIDYLDNTEEVIYKVENAGFSEDDNINNFEHIITTIFQSKEFSYFIVGSLVYLLISPNDYKKNQEK